MSEYTAIVEIFRSVFGDLESRGEELLEGVCERGLSDEVVDYCEQFIYGNMMRLKWPGEEERAGLSEILGIEGEVMDRKLSECHKRLVSLLREPERMTKRCLIKIPFRFVEYYPMIKHYLQEQVMSKAGGWEPGQYPLLNFRVEDKESGNELREWLRESELCWLEAGDLFYGMAWQIEEEPGGSTPFLFARFEDKLQPITNVPHRVVHHSPDGFEWGYSGSGPTELGLNVAEHILLQRGEILPRVRVYKDHTAHEKAYQSRAAIRDIINQNLPNNATNGTFAIRYDEVEQWVDTAIERTERGFAEIGIELG